MAPRPLYGAAARAELRRQAVRYGVDPDALDAVASGEGGYDGAVGDNGTSFGPLQLHAGGALPGYVWLRGPAYAKAWANSPAGLAYGAREASKYARGKTGQQAADAIVLGFERPADPTHDLQAVAGYFGGGPRGRAFAGGAAVRTRPGGDTGGGITGALGGLFHGAEGALESVLGLVSGPADFFKFLIALLDPRNWLRAVELLAGLGLLFVAIGGWLYLFGQADDAPAPVRSATRSARRVVTTAASSRVASG